MSSNVSDVFPNLLKLSSEVSECKPLQRGAAAAAAAATHAAAAARLTARHAGERAALDAELAAQVAALRPGPPTAETLR